MKKYISGILPIILAIGLSAFSVPSKKKTYNKIFQIKATVDLTQHGAVSLYTNWEEAPIQDFDCISAQHKACKIEVSEYYYTGGMLNYGIVINEMYSIRSGMYCVHPMQPGDVESVNNTLMDYY